MIRFNRSQPESKAASEGDADRDDVTTVQAAWPRGTLQFTRKTDTDDEATASPAPEAAAR